MEQDEIYLIDMWRLLVRQWRWFVAILVLVLAAAWGLRSPLQLDILTTVRAGALFTAIMLLAIWVTTPLK